MTKEVRAIESRTNELMVTNRRGRGNGR